MTVVPAAGGTFALTFPADDGAEFFYTPTDTAEVVFRIIGDPLDTYIDLYTYPDYDYVGDDDDSGPGLDARLQVTLVAGVQYVFYTQEFSNVAGTATLYVEPGAPIPPPPAPGYVVANDTFAAATELAFTANAESVPYDNTGATTETGEPTGRQTIWFTYVAPSGPSALLLEANYTGTSQSDKPTLRLYTGSSVGALSQVNTGSGMSGTGVTYSGATGVERIAHYATAGTRYYLRMSFEDGTLAGYWTQGTLRFAPMEWSEWVTGEPLLNQILAGRHYVKQTGAIGHYLDGGFAWYTGTGSRGGDRAPVDHPAYDVAAEWVCDGVFSYTPSNLSINSSLGADYPLQRSGPECGLGGYHAGAQSYPLIMMAWARMASSGTRSTYRTTDSTFPWRVQANASQGAMRMQLDTRAAQILRSTAGPTTAPDGSAVLGFQYDTSVDRVLGARLSVNVRTVSNRIGAATNTSASLNAEVRAFQPDALQATDSLLSELITGNEFSYRSADGRHAIDNGIANGKHAFERQYNGVKPNNPTDIEAFAWCRPQQLEDMPLLMAFQNTGAVKDTRTLVADLMPYRDARHQVMILVNLELHRTGEWARSTGSTTSDMRGDHDVTFNVSSLIDLERRYRYLIAAPEPEPEPVPQSVTVLNRIAFMKGRS
jgi:hypothetical protein